MSSIVTEALTWQGAAQRAEKIAKHMSPAGALQLPEKLDERRLRYGIADEAFRIQATFKRIFVHQIPEWDGETYGPDSKIVRTEISKKRDREATPRGVLIGAGLESREVLYSHGIELGDIVWIVQLAVFRLPYLSIDGIEERMLVLQVGDIVGCEDTATRLRDKEMVLVHDRRVNYDGYSNNDICYEHGDGTRVKQVSPWIADDF